MKEHIVDILTHYGLSEVEGEGNNLEIVKMFQEIGFTNIKDDQTSWCSALANYFCFKYGYERSKSLAARSWLKVGTETKTPEIGDIVVFWRKDPKSWEGHVAFFISKVGSQIYVLGGNQSNMLNISAYPESRVLGYRKIKKL